MVTLVSSSPFHHPAGVLERQEVVTGPEQRGLRVQGRRGQARGGSLLAHVANRGHGSS